MSKRKRDWTGQENGDQNEVKENKRRKHEQRAAADAKGAVNQETSPQLVNGPTTDDTGAVQPASARRLSHSRRKGQERKKRTRNTSKSAAANDAVTRDGGSKKREQRTERRREKRERKGPQWIVSDPVGGQMLNIDPLFSLDEESALRFI